MIKEQPEAAYKVMGADVNQTPEQFKDSAKFVKWYDRDRNKEYLGETLPKFLKEANDIMVEARLVRRPADVSAMIDASFVK
jgi:NitT/TauT family transport system substrate-binding protein